MAKKATTSDRCKCGQPLGKRKLKCALCHIKSHPASSQCPTCFEWYYSHGGQSYAKDVKHHATRACKKQAA